MLSFSILFWPYMFDLFPLTVNKFMVNMHCTVQINTFWIVIWINVNLWHVKHIGCRYYSEFSHWSITGHFYEKKLPCVSSWVNVCCLLQFHPFPTGNYLYTMRKTNPYQTSPREFCVLFGLYCFICVVYCHFVLVVFIWLLFYC